LEGTERQNKYFKGMNKEIKEKVDQFIFFREEETEQIAAVKITSDYGDSQIFLYDPRNAKEKVEMLKVRGTHDYLFTGLSVTSFNGSSIDVFKEGCRKKECWELMDRNNATQFFLMTDEIGIASNEAKISEKWKSCIEEGILKNNKKITL
jgi:hypothetical protein